MVRWFDPLQLIQTGIRKAISETFGDYADKRELQAALDLKVDVDGRQASRTTEQPRSIRVSQRATSRDAIEATSGSTTSLTSATGSRRHIRSRTSSHRRRCQSMAGRTFPAATSSSWAATRFTPRPRAKATRTSWSARTRALPNADPPPDLYAIPGNHDWYDGLANFLRFFCMNRAIGGWETRQTRSYFAARLPKGWWLWGIDIQFEGYIDEPRSSNTRRDRGGRSSNPAIASGSFVTGKPSWMDAPAEESAQYANLRYPRRT